MRSNLKRTISFTPKIRNLKKKNVVRAPLNVVPEHPLITMARQQTDDRYRQFYVSLAHALPILTPYDIDAIEPILRSRVGANVVTLAKKALFPSS